MGIEDIFQGTLQKDLLALCCGDRLGEGAFREVFIFAPNDTQAIKFENGAGDFQNITEWQVWEAVQYVKKINMWFAPCRAISPCGTILLQDRTEPIFTQQLPDKVPAFFTDLKASNWGLLNGRPVCHDYGLHLLLERGMTTRMVKADWDE